jgi:hypothetical protein
MGIVRSGGRAAAEGIENDSPATADFKAPGIAIERLEEDMNAFSEAEKLSAADFLEPTVCGTSRQGAPSKFAARKSAWHFMSWKTLPETHAKNAWRSSATGVQARPASCGTSTASRMGR